MNTLTNRSRVSSSPSRAPDALVHYVAPGFTGDFDVGPAYSPLLYKSIDDWTGKLKSKSGIFPPSDTVQASFDCKDLRPLHNFTQQSGGLASITWRKPTYPPVPLSAVFNFPVVSDDSWQIFAEEAFKAFSTQIPTDVSIANFTWELRDLGQLLPKLESSVQKTLSGAFLSEEFGWKPFLADLNKLSGLLSTVTRKIEYLKRTWGKKTRLSSYRPNAVEISLPFYNSIVTDIRLSHVTYSWELVGYRSDLRAGGYLYHKLKDLDSVYGYIRALMVSLGLDNPLRAVWQALPYSFVVDWFLGLTRQLGKLSVNPFKGDWSVSDFTSSSLTTARWKVTQVIDNPSATLPLGFISAKRYVRISRLPVPASFFTLQIPTPQQLLLSNAMLAQH